MPHTDLKRTIWIGALTSLLALMVGACDQSESLVAGGNRSGIFHYGNGTEPQTIDPHVMSGSPEVNIAMALFEGLVVRDPQSLKMVPGAAERWELSADKRTMTFFLNPRGRWSNGDPVTAHDFVWSLQRSLNPKLGNLLAYTLFPILNAEAYATARISDPTLLGITAIDDLTLQITLTNPTPYFLQTLGTYPTYPVHRATVEAHGGAAVRFTPWTKVENIVGNGPFVLEEWEMYRRITVSKSSTYWDAENVTLNKVVFHPIENTSAEEKMFRVGQLHFSQRVPLSKIRNYQAMDNSPYQQTPMLGTYYLSMNLTASPLDDVRVRMALAMSINRQQIIETVLDGSERPATALTPPGIPGYTPPDTIRYNPEHARSLLAAAGYPDGEGWPGLTYLYNTAENHRKIAVTLQQMWKKELNIDVELINQEWKVYLETLNNKDFQIARAGWIGGMLDPRTFLSRFITTGGTNRTGFSNARYDEIMLKEAPETSDPVKRMDLLHEAETILMQELPLIPLFAYNSKHLVQPSVEGAIVNLLDVQNFKFINLNPDTPVWTPEG
ncbi:MAG: peptide ABC transporter substrate-binding protein [Halioglobus sp.]